MVCSLLQWGRNFIVAEIPRRQFVARTFCPLLQWGRNFIVAEMYMKIMTTRALSMLQWGRNFIVAEMPASVMEVYQCGSASMGPQLYRCGNSSLAEPPAATTRRFNGAATLSLRKCASCSLYGIRHLSIASMGPQLYRCGNEDGRAKKINAASMGPQLYRCGNVLLAHCMVYGTLVLLQWGRNFIVAEMRTAGPKK